MYRKPANLWGGLSRDTFYRYKAAVEEGGMQALFDRTRHKPNLKNRVDERIEQAVVACAVEQPAHGQVRVSNEPAQAWCVRLGFRGALYLVTQQAGQFQTAAQSTGSPGQSTGYHPQ